MPISYKTRIECQTNQNPDMCLDSPMERIVYNELKTSGSCPVMQYMIGKYFVDFAFPDLRLVIEYNGESHKDFDSFQKDKIRAGEIHSLGWSIMNITWEGNFFNLTNSYGLDMDFETVEELCDCIAVFVRSERRDVLTNNK